MEGEDVIPENLEANALQTLGPYARRVQNMVRRLNRIHWLARAGMPEEWDSKVERVSSLTEARKLHRTFVPVDDAVWKSQTEIAEVIGRSALLRAAEDFWIARFDPRFDHHNPSYTHELLFAAVRSDSVGALRELVLEDIVPMRFFRDAIGWYEKGHWRAAITDEGMRVIY